MVGPLKTATVALSYSQGTLPFMYEPAMAKNFLAPVGEVDIRKCTAKHAIHINNKI